MPHLRHGKAALSRLVDPLEFRHVDAEEPAKLMSFPDQLSMAFDLQRGLAVIFSRIQHGNGERHWSIALGR